MNRKVKVKEFRKPRSGRKSTSRVSSKNQITIPVDILRMSGISEGDTVRFEASPGKVIVSSSVDIEHPLSGLIGIGGDLYKDFDLAKERESAWRR